MKKFLLLFALCGFFSFQAKAEIGKTIISETDRISITKATANLDQQRVSFDISLEGSDVIYAGYQITLELPEGLALSHSNTGTPRVSLRKSSNSPYPTIIEEEETDDGDFVEKEVYPHELTCSYNEDERILTIIVVSLNKKEEARKFIYAKGVEKHNIIRYYNNELPEGKAERIWK